MKIKEIKRLFPKHARFKRQILSAVRKEEHRCADLMVVKYEKPEFGTGLLEVVFVVENKAFRSGMSECRQSGLRFHPHTEVTHEPDGSFTVQTGIARVRYTPVDENYQPIVKNETNKIQTTKHDVCGEPTSVPAVAGAPHA